MDYLIHYGLNIHYNMTKIIIVPITPDDEIDLMYDGLFYLPNFKIKDEQDSVEVAKQVVYQYYQYTFEYMQKTPYPFENRTQFKHEKEDLDIFVIRLPFGENIIPNRDYVRPKISYIMNYIKNVDDHTSPLGSFQSNKSYVRRIMMDNSIESTSMCVIKYLFN
jgi:hypothetical protein